jgi:hypothetical protein
LPSLCEYLTVAQDRPYVEHHFREAANRWGLTEFQGQSGAVQLPSIGCTLSVPTVYAKIEWAP